MTAVLFINMPLRCEEDIVKAHILDLKHMSPDELERGMRERKTAE